MTVTQIELMQTDLPHTLYLKRGKDGKVKKGVDPEDKAFALQAAAVEKARLKHERQKAKAEGREPEFTLDEIFSGENEK